MTLTVTASALTSRVQVNVTTTLGGAGRVAVARNHPDGTQWPVLTDTVPRLIGGSCVVLDYLCPAMDVVTYTATTSSEIGLSGAVVVLLDSIWLMSPVNPSWSMPVLKATAVEDDDVQPQAGVFSPIGSDQATAISDQTLKTTSSISVVIRTDQVPGLRRLLRDGGPILINVPARPGWPFRWRWIQPTSWAFGSAPYGSFPERTVKISYVVVNQPTSNLQSPWDCAAAADAYADCEALANAYADCAALATDTRL